MAATAQRGIYVATIMRPEGDTGVQTHCKAFLRVAERRGARAELLTPFDRSPAVVYPSFGIGRLIKPFSKSIWVWWYRRAHSMLLRQVMLRRLERRVPTVVYAQDPLSAWAALEVKGRGFPIEVVLIVHFNVSQADEWVEHGCIERGGRMYRSIAELECRVLPRVDRLIFSSHYMMERVAERIGEIKLVPRWCIPNFVTIGPAAGSDRTVGDLISVGTLDARKNHAFLLRVLAACHGLGHPYRLTIVGNGPLRVRLLGLAERLGVASHVAFRGYVHEAAALLPRHRAYVHAATIENCPNALIEALAAGLPIFAAPVGGIPELVTDGVEGKFWDLDDPESAARMLIGLLEASPVHARASAAAKRRHRRCFTPEAVGPRLLGAVLGTIPVMPQGGGHAA